MRQTKRLFLALLLSALLLAVGTRTDITGTNAAVQVATSGTARWVQFVAAAANTAPVRVGPSTVTSTSGASVAPGGGLMLPYKGDNYQLPNLYVYVATGDTVSVLWEN
jgi:hypothetical protein